MSSSSSLFTSFWGQDQSILKFQNSKFNYLLSVLSFRMVNLARDYSTRRKAFGSVLKDYPLHIQTLARMEVRVAWLSAQGLPTPHPDLGPYGVKSCLA